ncbi:SbcC/MukB-like Walker B domain-containing protein [Echinicola sediminis]
MIPIKLEIEGLYSYKEKQTIDFSQLTAAGLFGIFGAVGSGKSSILEAVLLALYGTTERLASKGEKNSMVNLQSPGIAINFEFKAGKNNGQTFKASYLAKRNSKNFDDVKPATHTFYEMTDQGWLPLEARGEELVGMKMDHFRQTVIIPQGKFRDFIEQKPKDRADMMKELFGLERFDLSDRTRRLLSEEKEKKIKLETLLGSLEEFTKALLQEAEEQLTQLLKKKEAQNLALSEKEALLRNAQALKDKAELLRHQQLQLQKLNDQLPAYQRKRDQLSQFQTALTYLKPILDQLKEQEVELEKYQVSVTDCERFKTAFEQEIAEKEARYQKLYQDFSKKGDKEARIRDLIQIKELNQLESQKVRLDHQLELLEQKTQTFQEERLKQEKHIHQLEQALEKLNVPDMELVSKLEATAVEMKQNSDSHRRLTQQLSSLEEEIQTQGQAAQSILAKNGMETDAFPEQLELTAKALSKLEKEREILLQQQGLFTYAHQLKEGQPCPLCGALEHPDPLSHGLENGALSQNELEIQQLKTKLDQLRSGKSDFEKIQVTLDSHSQNQLEKQREIQALKERNHSLMLPFDDIADLESLEKKLRSAKSHLLEEKSLHQQLKSLSSKHKQFLSEAEKDLEQFQEASQESKTLQAKTEAKLAEINYRDLLEKYQGVGPEKIDEDINKVKNYLEELETNLPRVQDALNEARQKQATNLANLETYRARFQEVRTKLAKLKEELALTMAEHGFADSGSVRQLLGSPIKPKELEEEIRAFDRQRDITHSKIQELLEEKGVADFDPAAFEPIQEAYLQAKKQLEEIQKSLSLLQNRIEEIKVKLEEKAQLSKEFQQVENRESNLKELAGLFQGSGFVKYVSNIYLKELVQTANLRFMKLAKNSLSLEVDENNTFWVQDHLNGGKKRLLKTLSGGQTFQASLCLALALAEKVKSLNRADQSFFFLDEGFGALDKNALRTVFETLKSLRHEKRIVGIISHVEELQQEIGVFAQVELDPEKGSQVSYSY